MPPFPRVLADQTRRTIVCFGNLATRAHGEKAACTGRAFLELLREAHKLKAPRFPVAHDFVGYVQNFQQKD